MSARLRFSQGYVLIADHLMGDTCQLEIVC